jgi:hypothetical protein
MENLDLLIKEIEKEIQILEKWAEESIKGGWSTHQVTAQKQRAIELKAILYDINKKL